MLVYHFVFFEWAGMQGGSWPASHEPGEDVAHVHGL